MLPHLKSLSLLPLLGLLLVACSQTSLAYRNLDWLIPWRVNSYLDLDTQQKAWLKPQIKTHLNWHCSSELPGYLDWLQHTRSLVLAPNPNAEQVDAQLLAAEQAFQAIVRQTNPTAVALLASLSDEQVDRLYTRMDKDYREDQQKYLAPNLQTQIDERAERMEKRLRAWFGTLNDKQRGHVAEWAEERRDQSRQWLEGRARWQREFRQALDTRGAVDFPQRMTRALENRRGEHDPQAEQSYLQSRQALARLFSALLGNADEQQRARLLKRIDSLQRDLAEQVCTGLSGLTAAATASR